MSTPAPASAAALVTDLAASVRGTLLAAGDAGYDEAHLVYNAAYDDHRPAAVVRPVDADDVAAVVAFARDRDVELAVRGGHHGFAGYAASDGGLVLDLSALRTLDVDPDARIVTAGAGLTAGDVTAAAAEHGLAPVFGDTATVGITGITLGGGTGWLVRKHGTSADNLLGAEVVTADGQVLTVDADSHPDLFWALRGGGGGFGVVTRLRFRLHPVRDVVGGMLVLPLTPQVLRGFVRAATDAPEELSAIAIAGRMPPLPFLPEAVHGQLAMVVSLVALGDPDEAAQAVAPLRALAEPYADLVGPTTYPAMFEAEGGPPRARFALRSTFVDDLDEATAADVVARLADAPTPMGTFQVRVLGGAVTRVGADDTAFAHRDRAMMIAAGAGYMDPAQEPAAEAWVEDVVAALPGASGAGINFLSSREAVWARRAYPEGTARRLAAVKERYDPAGVFRLGASLAAL